MMIKKIRHKNSGQLLVEALIGISVVVVGLLGIVGLVSRSLSLNKVVSEQFTANYLSLEGIEIVKNLIDANALQRNSWNKGFQSGGDFNLDYESDLSAALSSGGFLYFDGNFYNNGSLGDQTIFKRTIKITSKVNNDDNQMKIDSIVEWTSRGGGKFSVDNESYVYNLVPPQN